MNVVQVQASDLIGALGLGGAVAELERKAAALARDHGFEIATGELDRAIGRARNLLRTVTQAMLDWTGGKVSIDNGLFVIDLRAVSHDDLAEAKANGGFGWLMGFAERYGFPGAPVLLTAYLEHYIDTEVGFSAHRRPRITAREFGALVKLARG